MSAAFATFLALIISIWARNGGENHHPRLRSLLSVAASALATACLFPRRATSLGKHFGRAPNPWEVTRIFLCLPLIAFLDTRLLSSITCTLRRPSFGHSKKSSALWALCLKPLSGSARMQWLFWSSSVSFPYLNRKRQNWFFYSLFRMVYFLQLLI